MAVIKILSRHSASYESLLKYILKVSKPGEQGVRPFSHNIRATDIKGMTHEFKENESYRKLKRRPNSVMMYHEIIGFSTADKVSVEKAEDIARKYMELRGYTGLFVGAVHSEKEHIHVHLCTSGLHFRTGRAFRLSRAALQALKRDVQAYHLKKYPEITQSTCEHGRGTGNKNNKQWFIKKRNDLKAEVERTVSGCLTKATTQKEFLELLRDQSLHHYERSKNGVPTGIVANNTKFRFTHLNIDLGRLQGLPIDLTEEEKALKEIDAIRQLRKEGAQMIGR